MKGMSLPPFPVPPSGDDVRDAAERLANWQTSIIFLLSGIGGSVLFIGRSVSGWARKLSDRHDTHFTKIEDRIETLETHRHATDMRIVALESLAREVDSIGRRVDAGFERVNETLYNHFTAAEDRGRRGD